MTPRRFIILFFSLFALCGLAFVARAQVVDIPGLYTTGVNNSNVLLGNTQQDTHYIITANTTGNSGFNGNAVTVRTASLPATWTPNTSTARWITPPRADNDNNPPNAPIGTFDYTLTFTMPAGAQLSSVVINGIGAVDDTAKIYVNGVLVTGQTLNSYGATNSFSLNSSNANFQAGTNTITFRVNNIGGPTGLLVSSISGTAIVPEVGTFLPIAGALGVSGFVMWRRRRERREEPPTAS